MHTNIVKHAFLAAIEVVLEYARVKNTGIRYYTNALCIQKLELLCFSEFF